MHIPIRHQLVNYYHSDLLSTDTEGNLVMLCNTCADAQLDQLDDYAQDGDTECSCEKCDASQRRISNRH